jgi:hypothetical protein
MLCSRGRPDDRSSAFPLKRFLSPSAAGMSPAGASGGPSRSDCSVHQTICMYHRSRTGPGARSSTEPVGLLAYEFEIECVVVLLPRHKGTRRSVPLPRRVFLQLFFRLTIFFGARLDRSGSFAAPCRVPSCADVGLAPSQT